MTDIIDEIKAAMCCKDVTNLCPRCQVEWDAAVEITRLRNPAQAVQSTGPDLERAAKALWDLAQQNTYSWSFSNPIMFGEEWRGKPVPWEVLLSENVVPSAAEEYRNKIRAVITTLREPSDEVLYRGVRALNFNPNDPASSHMVAQALRAMIDAILEAESV